MLHETVNEFLDNAGYFSDNFKSGLDEMLHTEFYKNKQIVHAVGQVESALYLIKTGFARDYYYDHNGEQYTVKFWKPGEVIFSYEGYYRVPSFYYTEFLDLSEVVTLSYHHLDELQQTFPETFTLVKYALLKNRKEEYERQRLLTLSANERYESLFLQSPIIFQKSPVKFIASYLHMSRETLARLMTKR